jgi:type IV pilus biogenesis protein CpaD/CtpE
MVDAADVAKVVHRLLLPFASRVAFARNWVVEPIALGAAIAGVGAGCSGTDDLFEEAIDVAVRLDAPVLRARAEIAWAWSVLRSATIGRDRERLRARVDDARAVFADHRLDALDRSAAELVSRVSG